MAASMGEPDGLRHVRTVLFASRNLITIRGCPKGALQLNCLGAQASTEAKMDVRSRSLAVVVFLIASLAAAQAATVHGKVTDPLGAAVANARVELLSKSSKAAETKTDSEGEYQLEIAQPGRFHLRVTAPSFAPAESEWFYVGGAETVSRDVFLKPRKALPSMCSRSRTSSRD